MQDDYRNKIEGKLEKKHVRGMWIFERAGFHTNTLMSLTRCMII